MDIKTERKDILMKSPYPWWEWNVINNTVDFNDKKATMLGYAPEVFKFKGFQVFTDLLHPEDYKKTMNAMKVLLNGEKDLYQVDYRIKASNGKYRWYMDRGIVTEITDEGDIKIIRGIVIDLGNEANKDLSKNMLVTLLKKSVNTYNSSASFLTICSNCRKIKLEDNQWASASEKIIDTIGENISHGICPECIKSLYPDFADSVLAKCN